MHSEVRSIAFNDAYTQETLYRRIADLNIQHVQILKVSMLAVAKKNTVSWSPNRSKIQQGRKPLLVPATLKIIPEYVLDMSPCKDIFKITSRENNLNFVA